MIDRDELFNSNMKWAKGFVRRVHNEAPYDVMSNAALMGLFVACTKWNGAGSFRGFATVHIKGHIIDCFRKETGMSRGTHKRCYGFFSDLPDTGNEDDEFDRVDRNEQLMNALKKMNPRDRKILIEYFVEEKTLKQIGEERGVGQSRICQLVRKALQSVVI